MSASTPAQTSGSSANMIDSSTRGVRTQPLDLDAFLDGSDSEQSSEDEDESSETSESESD